MCRPLESRRVPAVDKQLSSMRVATLFRDVLLPPSSLRNSQRRRYCGTYGALESPWEESVCFYVNYISCSIKSVGFITVEISLYLHTCSKFYQNRKSIQNSKQLIPCSEVLEHSNPTLENHSFSVVRLLIQYTYCWKSSIRNFSAPRDAMTRARLEMQQHTGGPLTARLLHSSKRLHLYFLLHGKLIPVSAVSGRLQSTAAAINDKASYQILLI